ncbi:MAG: cytochrome ubiquinol oxidase subunit I, partial [Mucinivorans sp.]
RIYFDNFGYGYLKSSAEMVPPVGLVFWSFRVMVFLGLWLMAVCAAVLWTTRQGRRDIRRGWLYIFLWAIPLAYLASQAGWVVCEVGRQPWTIQNLLPTVAAVSRLESSAVALTFWIFVALFTALLAAEVTIMCKQIKKGPADVTENLTEKTTENLTENSTEKK